MCYTDPMYEQTLIHTGLTPNQAAIYELLLRHGEDTAGGFATVSPLKRSFTYKVLGELVKLGLVAKTEKPRAVARFAPLHPLKLRELTEKREKEFKDAQLALSGILPSLVSEFNLVSGQPGILFFEGMDGVQRVADDSLTAKTEILSYLDLEAIHKYIPKLNESYIHKREKLKKQKRILLTYSEYNKKHFEERVTNVTEVRFLNYKLPSFHTIMQIYDSKATYIVLTPDHMIGVIIENEWIAKMHRSLFEYTWATAEQKSMPPSADRQPIPPEHPASADLSQTPRTDRLDFSGPSGTPR